MTAQTGVGARQAPGYEVRLVTDEAIEQAENIWSLAFGSGWARDYSYRDLSRIYGAFKGNELHALVAVCDFDMHFAGQWVPCGGISAVATVPGQRYQNLITTLIKQALQDLHDRGVPFSCLYPFSYPFYEKMGWACTHNNYTIELEVAWLKRIGAAGHANRFRLLAPEQRDLILPVHERCAEQFNLSLRRTAALHKTVMQHPHKRWQLFSHPDAYMLWDMGESQGSKLVVREFGYADQQAFWDGLALLAQMEAQFDTVQWVEPGYEHLLRNGVPYPRPHFVGAPSMMTRVVNLEAFQQALAQPLGNLPVCDPLAVSGGADATGINPGALVQLVTGYFGAPDERFPAARHLHGIAGDKRTFTREQF